MTYGVDTHALMWFLEGSFRLGTAARNALSDTAAPVVVPIIVLAQITFLYARHRIAIDLPHALAHIASAVNCLVYPFEAPLSHMRLEGHLKKGGLTVETPPR